MFSIRQWIFQQNTNVFNMYGGKGQGPIHSAKAFYHETQNIYFDFDLK